MSESSMQGSHISSVCTPTINAVSSDRDSSSSFKARVLESSTVPTSSGVSDTRPSVETSNLPGPSRPVSKDSSTSSAVAPSVAKIQIHLRAVAGAPALVTSKFNIDGSKSVLDVELFLRKKLGHAGALFLYCGGGFSPTPDQTLADLYECFQISNELVIQYGLQEIWG